MRQTTLAKKGEIARNWVLVDLKDLVLGRVASGIADILRGKNKPVFTPYEDTGDFVVAINASQIRVTGKKLDQKTYYNYSGFKGGLKSIVLKDLLKKDPTEVIRRAVRGMLPKNRLSRHILNKLNIYPGAEHPHAAQMPKAVEVRS